MATFEEVLSAVVRVSDVQLVLWIEEEWVKPTSIETAYNFNEADIARVRLLDTLLNDLAIDHEAIPVILSLIDQVHDLRSRLAMLGRALEQESDAVKERVLVNLQKLD